MRDSHVHYIEISLLHVLVYLLNGVNNTSGNISVILGGQFGGGSRRTKNQSTNHWNVIDKSYHIICESKRAFSYMLEIKGDLMACKWRALLVCIV